MSSGVALLAGITGVAGILGLFALLAGRVRPYTLALGFAGTAAQWALTYVAMIGVGLWAGEALFGLTVLVPVAVGFVAQRYARDQASAFGAGMVNGVMNLLVVGSVVGGKDAQAAVVEAEAIIDDRVTGFLHWMESRETVPTIRALRDSAERARRHEVDHALKLLARGDDPVKVLEALSHGLTNKLMHAPTHTLNQAEGADRTAVAQLISRIYNLHPGE